MATRKLSRVSIFALITCALLFLMPDRIHDTLLNKNVNYSYVPFTRGKQNIDRTMRAHIEQAYGKLPMRFEANEGQTDARVKFIARGAGYSVFLTGAEAVLRLHKREGGSGRSAEEQTVEKPVESTALRVRLAGSNPSGHVSGVGRLSATSNYFIRHLLRIFPRIRFNRLLEICPTHMC
jgi:hypothetical protein